MTRDALGLFEPERVAVIGVTECGGSIGRAVFSNIDTLDGDVVSVNPSRDDMFGQRCFPESLLTEHVDIDALLQ